MGADATGPSLHHTAIAVRDLDRSIAFYRDVFGGEVEAVIRDVGDVHVAQLHALESACFTLAFVRFGPTRLELFQFAEPDDGRDVHARAHDFGIRHICFEVDDVDAAYARLTGAGVAFTRPPYVIPDGDAAGTALAFCFDPDGNRVELLQPPATAGRATAAATPPLGV
jgi:catechol 2,3-dioxygenase-like lactoylglutathione lyase family enzyme